MTSPRTNTYFLRPWPQEGWADTVVAAADRSWLWMDLTGTVVSDRPPADPVLTSWVWGWSGAEWVRLRLDGSRVMGAQLRAADPGDPSWRPVTGHRSTVPRVAPGGSGRNIESGGQVRVIEIDLPALVFMELLA